MEQSGPVPCLSIREALVATLRRHNAKRSANADETLRTSITAMRVLAERDSIAGFRADWRLFWGRLN